MAFTRYANSDNLNQRCKVKLTPEKALRYYDSIVTVKKNERIIRYEDNEGQRVDRNGDRI